MKKSLLALSLVFATQISFSLNLPTIQNEKDLATLFPKTASEQVLIKDEVLLSLKQDLEALNEISLQEATFENTLIPLDQSISATCCYASRAEALSLVTPDAELREETQKASVEYELSLNAIFSDQPLLFEKISLIQKSLPQESLEYRLCQTFLNDFKHAGQHLDPETKQKAKEVHKEIAQLEQSFAQNIQADQSQLILPKSRLVGLKEEMLESFEKSDNELYTIRCDYPSYNSIMTNCTAGDTRKDYFLTFNKRAHINNRQVLTELIAKRDEYAKLMGYSSYGHLALEDKMVQSPENAFAFLQSLADISEKKAYLENERLKANLPSDVSLTEDQKFYPWDLAYAHKYYLKNSYQLDADLVAEYFPLQKTFSGLMGVYEAFFGIQINEIKAPELWDPEVRLMEVRGDANSLIGYVILDLFPRPGKYSHACDCGFLAVNVEKNGRSTPGLDLIVANFTRPTSTKPSLLKHNEVVTLFHEFGHALHDLFSTQPYATFCGLGQVKRDFVEMPSQLLEEWMWQPEILKQVSSHYASGEPLPDQLIETMLKVKNLNSGNFIRRQTYLSLLDLSYFAEGQNKDVHQICQDLKARFRPEVAPYDDHFYASFGHLTGYGSCYYGYMWSKVFALDLFAKIQNEGILNSAVGKQYREQILKQGGSQDPNILLKNFLNRKPSLDAFQKDLGLNAL